MREIKFRGRSRNSGRWVYGDLITQPYKGRSGTHIYEKRQIGYQFVRIDPKTLGQFTGLFDKNGKEIYEDDIVNCRVLRLSGNSSSWSQKTNINHGKCRILPMQVVYKKPFVDCYCKYGCYDFILTKKADSLIKEYEKPVGKEQNDQIINWYNIDNDDILEVIGNIYDNPELLEVEE